MCTLDIVILIILAVGLWQGISDGFAKSLCSFAGFVVGLVAAYMFYSTVGAKLAPHLDCPPGVVSVVAFLLIWIAVPVALNFAGTIVTKFFEMLMLGGVNKLAGGALGVIKYFLGATLVVYVLVLTGLLSKETTDQSFFGSMMVAFVESFMAGLRATA